MGQTIPSGQARGLFTQQLIAVYKQRPRVKTFLQKFFPEKVGDTRYLYWAVRREGEPVAINVTRGTEGNRNTFSIETDKVVDPPYYDENFDLTSTDLYYRAWNSQNVDSSVMADWMAWTMEKMDSVTNKIKRSLEKQRADILQTGIVQLANGDFVDFKRNPLSIVDLGAGNYFTDDVDPVVTFFAPGIKRLREVGKAEGGNFVAIFGESAINGFLNNKFVLQRGRDFFMKLTELQMPKMEADGSSYHGRFSVGSYTVDVYSYPESYDAVPAASSPTRYIADEQCILLPERPEFITGFAAVPWLPMSGAATVSAVPRLQRGAFVGYEYMDQRQKSWIAGVNSAGIALPTAIDMIYNGKVVASA